MKKLTYLVSLLPFIAFGQSQDKNYIKTTTYKVPSTSSILTPSLNQAVESTSYFDGMGRLLQMVTKGQSGNGKSMTTVTEYDAFGRQLKEYLPYVSQRTDLDYIDGALTEVLNYPEYQGKVPYEEKILENSPLNKTLKKSAPGLVWSMGSGKEIKIDYLTNTSQDGVKLYKATATWNSAQGVYDVSLSSAIYNEGQLYKTITKNENWTSGLNNTIEEYIDKDGRLVLKRTYNAGVSHDTYYVYDQYGNLSYVFPPLVDNPATQLNDLCYQYKYDNRNRLIEKKLPGKQWEYMVYDKLDRVVATGPAVSPFNGNGSGCLITKYDLFNRPVYTGWLSTNETRSVLQSQLNNINNNFSEKRLSGGTVDNINIGYTSVAFPTSGMKLLSVNYYDDYNYPNAPTNFDPIEGQTVCYNNTVKPKGLQTGTWLRIPDLSASATGELSYSLYDSKDRAIRSKTINYLGGYTTIDSKFDFSGKVIYSVTRHSRAGVGEIYIKDSYTYSDQDRMIKHTHQVGENGIPQLLAKNEYDELGRLIVKRTGGTDLSGTNPLQKIDYTYNIKGWLKEINKIDNLIQAGNPDDLFAFKINYETVENTVYGEIKPLYNGNISETFWRTSSNDIIRSYGYKYDDLNRLNRALYQKSGSVFNSYDEEISYDKNGNITDLSRNGGYDGDFMALEMDRLAYSYHPQKKNQLMKVLDYSFNPEGFIDDSPDGYTDPVDDYAYDANGNMISDQNKGITQILYNHLNLPIKIVFGSESNKIEYLYDAAGKKVQKLVTEVGTPRSFTYLQGFQYKGKTLLFFPTAEGYVNYTPAVYGGSLENQTVITPESYNYVFNYKDHLGNIRLSYGLDPVTNALKIIEENHYYPFGLKHTNYSSGWNSFQRIDEKVSLRPGKPSAPLEYKYKFQGQERQEELGLNWDSFKWRNYDYAIGRFMNIDPLAPDFPQWSPYVFSGNLVTIAKELEGMEPDFLIGSDGKLSKGVVTLMNAAYGYSVSSLTNSTWIISTDPRVRSWNELTGHPEASVKGRLVMYSSKVVDKDEDYWFGLISHEQSHRQDIANKGSLSFYFDYLIEGSSKKYRDIPTEVKAYRFGSDKENVDMADRLLSYKNGAVMSIFKRDNLTDNEKATMLEAVGNQFKRDVVLQGNIDSAKSSLKKMKDMDWDTKTKASMTKVLNSLIVNWTNQQEEITKKYGK